MSKDKMFYKTVVKDAPKVSVRRISLLKVTILVLVALIIGTAVVQTIGLGSTIVSRWDAIKFAYEKPEIVQTVKKDYETKQQKLDQSFLNKTDKSEEEQLIDKVVEKLKSDDLK